MPCGMIRGHSADARVMKAGIAAEEKGDRQ